MHPLKNALRFAIMISAIWLLLSVFAQPAPNASSTDAQAAADAALDAIVSKCADCHGPQLQRPKGKFGYVTDLPRIASNPDYVTPGSPQDSEFWLTIDAAEMPPDDSDSGPLTAAEKDAIFNWIKLGAAAPSKSPPTPPAQASPAPAAASSTSHASTNPSAAPQPPKHTQTVLDKAALVLGRLHVLIIHFPIGLLVTAAALECFWLVRKIPPQLHTTRTLLWLGSAAALIAAGLGWIHALDGYPGPLSSPFTTTGIHRWLGSAAGIIAPLVAIIAELDIQRGRRSTPVRILIIFAAALVGTAAHFGGMLTYGDDFFSL